MKSLPTKGRWLWRREFYSLCSKHYSADPKCSACQTGQWINSYGHVISGFICKNFHPLWVWWMSRPNGRHMRFMKSAFPNINKPAPKGDGPFDY